jgi:hypothetical protein
MKDLPLIKLPAGRKPLFDRQLLTAKRRNFFD